jgi:hypothetical protein
MALVQMSTHIHLLRCVDKTHPKYFFKISDCETIRTMNPELICPTDGSRFNIISLFIKHGSVYKNV